MGREVGRGWNGVWVGSWKLGGGNSKERRGWEIGMKRMMKGGKVSLQFYLSSYISPYHATPQFLPKSDRIYPPTFVGVVRGFLSTLAAGVGGEVGLVLGFGFCCLLPFLPLVGSLAAEAGGRVWFGLRFFSLVVDYLCCCFLIFFDFLIKGFFYCCVCLVFDYNYNYSFFMLLFFSFFLMIS